MELEEHGSTGGVVAEGKELVSGDATVDCKQHTSLVCMMSTGFGCKFILGGVLGGSIVIWGISGGRLGSASNCDCGWVMLMSTGFSHISARVSPVMTCDRLRFLNRLQPKPQQHYSLLHSGYLPLWNK